VTDSDSDPLSRPLRPEVIPEDWLRAIEDCTSSPSITIVTGYSGSGKSNFAKRLVNRSLTGLGKNALSVPAVCYMDLDPKRQEYTPGGQISLLIVRDLNLGPNFTHPHIVPALSESTRDKVVRAHPMPMNFANYADYYQSCVEDLFLTYRNLCVRDPSLPLVIDTSGFLYTSNFDIINKLLTRLKPHNIVHLGDTQGYDTEIVARLHLLQTTASQYRSTIQEITAQQPQSTSIRTDAELSAMQMQSYFHLKSSSTNTGQPQILSWSSDPLSHLVPWEFCYEETSERTQDIVGFAMYSEPIEQASLLHALNGSLVHIIQSTSSIVPTPYTSLPRTGNHRIPYFPESERTGMVEPLDPRTTRLVCTAMIRGFDPEKKVVQVLVPKTHEALLYNLAPERTVFVGGCCDVPEWAFVEDAYARKEAGAQEQSGFATKIVDELPWVEREDAMDEMGYLNTVRRVRKFLGY
jgi:polynucleotide 5'-hydroxyl-kinase GRC3/NOL9